MNDFDFVNDLAKIFRTKSKATMEDFDDHAFSEQMENIFFALDHDGDSCVIVAPTGAGKTHLAFALCTDMQTLPHYLKFDDFVRDCEQKMYRGDNYRVHLHALCNARFLILEDMFASGWNPSENSPIFEDVLVQTIRERRMYLKPTLFLVSPEDFEDAKVADIFNKHSVQIFEFADAPDMRQIEEDL
jgi:DNA replication protein DnaC